MRGTLQPGDLQPPLMKARPHLRWTLQGALGKLGPRTLHVLALEFFICTALCFLLPWEPTWVPVLQAGTALPSAPCWEPLWLRDSGWIPRWEERHHLHSVLLPPQGALAAGSLPVL